MKSPFENRWFCAFFSLICAWFLFTDYSDNEKINIVNLMFFICSTYLALVKKKDNLSLSTKFFEKKIKK